jgi:hypothetical protein
MADKLQVALVLNRMIDIPVFNLLFQTSFNYSDFINTKIIVVNFDCIDEYNWSRKRKSIFSNGCTSQNIKSVVELNGNDNVIVCNSKEQYKNTIKQFDLCIARGVEYAVLKPIINKNIAICGPRINIERLVVDVMPYYEDKLKIFLQSNLWLDKKETGLFEYNSDFELFKKYKDRFEFSSVLNSYYDLVSSNLSKDKIKSGFNIPLDKKIAFLSLRKADPAHTMYENNEQFLKESIKMIKKFKDMGYYIVSRRRLSNYDVNVARKNSPENLKFDEIYSKLIDLEIDGYESHPPEVFLIPYISDVLLLSDTSGIANIESAIMKLPIYFPHNKHDTKFKEYLNGDSIAPTFRDMINNNLITNDYTQEYCEHYNNNIDKFLYKWYQGNIDDFWQKAFKYGISS